MTVHTLFPSHTLFQRAGISTDVIVVVGMTRLRRDASRSRAGARREDRRTLRKRRSAFLALTVSRALTFLGVSRLPALF